MEENHPSFSTVFNNVGLSYYSQAEYKKAAEQFQLSIQNEQSNLSQNLIAGSERQKREFINTFRETTNAVVSLHLRALPEDAETAQLAFNTILQRKGRILDVWSDSLQSTCQDIGVDYQSLCDDYEQVIEQRSNLEYLKRENSYSDSQSSVQLATLEDNIEDLEDQISRASADFKDATPSVTVSDIQALLPGDSALVEIVLYQPLIDTSIEDLSGGRDVQTDSTYNPYNAASFSQLSRFGAPRYAAYILKDSGVVQSVDLGSADTINASISSFKDSLSITDANGAPVTSPFQVRQEAQNLHRQIISPIRSALGDTTTVFIAPDGELNIVPFEALIDEEDEENRYLVEKYQFRYLTSGRDLLRLKEESAEHGDSALLLGNPDYNRSRSQSFQVSSRDIDFNNRIFGRLDYTQDEVDAIAPLLSNVEKLTEGEATESAVKRQESPSILHMATHGFFLSDESATNPLLKSGLILAGAASLEGSRDGQDGILSALEVSGLNLQGTQLAVLSACDTGQGESEVGEGVYGLRRALVSAGNAESSTQLVAGE